MAQALQPIIDRIVAAMAAETERGEVASYTPGRARIVVWSPGLKASGNSQLGTLALEMLAQETGWSVFSARH